MAVLCFAVIQWMTSHPLSATSLCLIVFLHILGVASRQARYIGLGNNVLLFLMGARPSAAMTSGLA
ncbi:MAG: hypothetical protein ACLSHC_03740 [Bilophila wadsworthia]